MKPSVADQLAATTSRRSQLATKSISAHTFVPCLLLPLMGAPEGGEASRAPRLTFLAISISFGHNNMTEVRKF